MKNIIFFLIFLCLFGCISNPLYTTKPISISCPRILLASDHKTYVGNNLSDNKLDNITYKAEINNFMFSEGCFTKDDIFSSNLSILFVVSPNKVELNKIFLPFYVMILNSQNQILDTQYYSVSGNFSINLETNQFIETDLVKKILINKPNINDSTKIIIGFMLDKKRLDFLN